VIPNSDVTTSVFKVRRLWIVTERQDTRFGTDRDVGSRRYAMDPTVEQAAEVDDIAVPELDFSPIEESATALNPCS